MSARKRRADARVGSDADESDDDDAQPDPQQVQATAAQQAQVVTLSRQGIRGNTFHEI